MIKSALNLRLVFQGSNFVQYANFTCFLSTASSWPFIKMRYRPEPKINPCGTRFNTSFYIDIELLICMHWEELFNQQ